jgi:hypothetical protein
MVFCLGPVEGGIHSSVGNQASGRPSPAKAEGGCWPWKPRLCSAITHDAWA